MCVCESSAATIPRVSRTQPGMPASKLISSARVLACAIICGAGAADAPTPGSSAPDRRLMCDRAADTASELAACWKRVVRACCTDALRDVAAEAASSSRYATSTALEGRTLVATRSMLSRPSTCTRRSVAELPSGSRMSRGLRRSSSGHTFAAWGCDRWQRRQASKAQVGFSRAAVRNMHGIGSTYRTRLHSGEAPGR